MKLGIITVHEMDYNPGDLIDLRKAAEDGGHRLIDLYVDSITLRIRSGEVEVRHWPSHSQNLKVDVGGAVLRHLGNARSIEHFFYRLWAIRALELAGVYVMNPSMSWLTASDKVASLLILAKSGVPVPKTVVCEDPLLAYRSSSELEDFVVKPTRGYMGFGSFKASRLDIGFHEFVELYRRGNPIYVQEYLRKEAGGDYRAVVVDGEVLGVEFRRGRGWKTNVAQGAEPTSAELKAELVELALKSVEVLGLDYAGVDVLESREGLYVIEVNPTISWQGFKRATGVNPAYRIVDALIRRAKR